MSSSKSARAKSQHSSKPDEGARIADDDDDEDILFSDDARDALFGWTSGRTEVQRYADEIKQEIDILAKWHERADRLAPLQRPPLDPAEIRDHIRGRLEVIYAQVLGAEPRKRRRLELMDRIDRLARGSEGSKPDIGGLLARAYDGMSDDDLAPIVSVWLDITPGAKQTGAAIKSSKWKVLADLLKAKWGESAKPESLRTEWKAAKKK